MSKVPKPEALTPPPSLLDGAKMKAFAGFVGALMVLHSFFGSIYRIPVQIERHASDLTSIIQRSEQLSVKLTQLEQTQAVVANELADLTELRKELSSMEKHLVESQQMRTDTERLRESIRELRILLDNANTKLTELSITTANLKEATVDNKNKIEQLRQRAP